MKDRTYEVAKYYGYDGYQRARASMVYKFVNQINYGLIKEENFAINLCKNGYTIMIF